jgi:hypothetical protein
VGSLRRICYEDRGPVYAAILHELENEDKMEAFRTLLGLTEKSPRDIIGNSGFPTSIDRKLALSSVNPADIQWLIEHGVLVAKPQLPTASPMNFCECD